MRQAQVLSWSQAPKCVEVPDLAEPEPDQVRVKVEAVGIHSVVRAKARGLIPPNGALPQILGVDGVGTLNEGTKVYFSSLASGSLSEYVNVLASDVFPLSEHTDLQQVAAHVNPAVSSWMALKERADQLPSGFSCMILGATSASGRIAIGVARALGSNKVLGVARDAKALAALGLDQTIVIRQDLSQTDFSNLGDVDVVLDYISGPLTEHLFNNLTVVRPLQYVHIGSLSSPQVTIPGVVLRTKNITVRGSGPAVWHPETLQRSLPEILALLTISPKHPIRIASLEDIETEWDNPKTGRLVVVPGLARV